jgi:predicted DNA-binding transcriptional regulator AlpA
MSRRNAEPFKTVNGGAEMLTPEFQVLRESERFRLTGLSRVQAWRLEREGKFPRRIKLGENSVGWLAHEIQAWIKAKAAGR